MTTTPDPLRAALAQALSDEVLDRAIRESDAAGHDAAPYLDFVSDLDRRNRARREELRAVLLDALLPVLAAPAWQPPNGKAQWTLDNIYTLARRELRKMEQLSYTDEERDGWRHVIRLCEAVGCQGRGVLRDNGGSMPLPAPPPRGPEEG